MRADFLDPRLPSRFWDKCVPEPMSGCWLWIGCATPHGYGRIGTGGHTTEYAHRLAYLTLIGPIPDGLELDHKCSVRCCANPAHLEPVTHAENNRRSTAGAVNGARQRAVTHCPRGHKYTEANTRVSKGKRHCRECRRPEAA